MDNLKKLGQYLASNLIAGVVLLAPIYLAVLLLLKAMSSVMEIMKPIANIVPEWLPAEHAFSLLLVLAACFLVGLAVRTALGKGIWEWIETNVCQKMPGYQLVRSLTHRLSGNTEDKVWKPVLAEIEEALVPAFIIEELDDGRFTVFVPSVPTPLAGAVYVLTPDRVHLIDVSFTAAIQVVSRWGSGTKDLVAAMEKNVEKTMEKKVLS